MNTRTTSPVLICGAVMLMPAALHADIINVSGGQSIQAAVNIAQDGDEVVVAPGTYFQTVDLLGKAITLRSSGGAAATTIDATNLFHAVIECTSGEGPDTIIEGFTLTGGDATDVFPNDRGGGLYSNGTSPTVRECVFEANIALYGGAFYGNAGTLSFTDCTFRLNDAVTDAGGVYLNNCTTTFLRCVFDRNFADRYGGGARFVSGSTTLEECILIENEANVNGGAIEAGNTTTTLIVESCLFDTNEATPGDGSSGRGGAMYTRGPTTVRNCVFQDNACDFYGGAIYRNTGSATIENSSFVGNSAGAADGAVNSTSGGLATVRNCMMWYNGEQPLGGSGALAVTYTNVEGGYAGAGNLGEDAGHEPTFLDMAGRDLRLAEGSMGIDAGDSASIVAPDPRDFDGNPRALDDPATADSGIAVFGITTDMGAFEFQPAGSEPTCTGDTNGDGTVDTVDLLAVLGAWGICP